MAGASAVEDADESACAQTDCEAASGLVEEACTGASMLYASAALIATAALLY